MSSNFMRVHFYIRLNKNQRNDYAVYCCIKTPRHLPREICVIQSISKNDWNKRRGIPKQSNDRLVKFSLLLDSIKAKLQDIYFESALNGQYLSAQQVKNIYLGKEALHYSLLQIFDLAVEQYARELVQGSLKNYSATKKYIQAFCKFKYGIDDVFVKSLTYSFIEEFKNFILMHPIKPNDPCTNNGCMKHLERLKKIALWAYEMRYIDRNLFSSFRIRKKRFEQRWLNWTQLKMIENKSFHTPLLNLVKDIFIFCCYTGMSPIDVQLFSPDQIYKDKDNLIWISYVRKKSNITANVPLLQTPLLLVKKYFEFKQGDYKTVFPYVCNKVLNDKLKMIGEICELNMPLTFYMARYTFATTVTLAQGVPITSIKKMLGHHKIESTLYYAKVSDQVIGSDMKLLQQRLDGME